MTQPRWNQARLRKRSRSQLARSRYRDRQPPKKERWPYVRRTCSKIPPLSPFSVLKTFYRSRSQHHTSDSANNQTAMGRNNADFPIGMLVGEKRDGSHLPLRSAVAYTRPAQIRQSTRSRAATHTCPRADVTRCKTTAWAFGVFGVRRLLRPRPLRERARIPWRLWRIPACCRRARWW